MHNSIYRIPQLGDVQKNLLLLRAMGYNTKEIGLQVFMAHRTVEGQFYRMRKMFKCKNDCQLLSEAFRLKIID
jgi:DNA-binding CsgD family transcriptional regulator